MFQDHTLGQEAVPQAMAATAWAPPARRMCVTPALRAQYSTSGEMLPSCRGGVARTTVLQPAMPAGSFCEGQSCAQQRLGWGGGGRTSLQPVSVSSGGEACRLRPVVCLSSLRPVLCLSNPSSGPVSRLTCKPVCQLAHASRAAAGHGFCNVAGSPTTRRPAQASCLLSSGPWWYAEERIAAGLPHPLRCKLNSAGWHSSKPGESTAMQVYGNAACPS